TAGQAKRISIFTLSKLEWQYSHHHKVGTVDTFVTGSDHRFNTEEVCTFSCPVTAGAHSVVIAGNYGKTGAILFIFHGCIINAHHFARRPVSRKSAFSARSNFVADTDVCKRTAHHHFMVTAPGTVRVEVS